MTDEKNLIKEWIRNREAAEAELDLIKAAEVSSENYARDALNSLASIFNYSLRNSEVKTSSGLVEMKKWLKKLCASEVAERNGDLRS